MLANKIAHNIDVARLLMSRYSFADLASLMWNDVLIDARKGIDTFSIISSEELFGKEEKRQNRYVPSTFGVINQMFDLCQEILGSESFEEMNFVDIGSGKGKVFIPSTKRGFRLSKGLEISEDLHEIAHKNMQKLGLSEQIQLLNLDATKFFPEPDDRVLYFFNPFMAEILDQCLSNIASVKPSGKRLLVLINPMEDEIFLKYFKKVRSGLATPGNIKYCIYEG